jgi:hypothetical protein
MRAAGHNAVYAAIVISRISTSSRGLGCRVNPIFGDRIVGLDYLDISALGERDSAAIVMLQRSSSTRALNRARIAASEILPVPGAL